MKKFIIIFFSIISLNSISNASEMTSIEKYLSDKDPTDHAATIYSLVRCSGLELFFATIMQEKAPDAVEILKQKSGEFALVASKLDSAISERNFEDSAKNMIKSSQEIMGNYIKDGKKNWSKTGSYFLDSYIDEDRLLCDYLYKTYVKK